MPNSRLRVEAAVNSGNVQTPNFLSGSSNDVQLRATVYACDTWDDWFLEALKWEEYNDNFSASICYVEENSLNLKIVRYQLQLNSANQE